MGQLNRSLVRCLQLMPQLCKIEKTNVLISATIHYSTVLASAFNYLPPPSYVAKYWHGSSLAARLPPSTHTHAPLFPLSLLCLPCPPPLAEKKMNLVVGPESSHGDGARTEEVHKVPFLKLFAFADTWDYVLMALGSIGACAHGASVPIFFIFFGKLINIIGVAFLFPTTVSHRVAKVRSTAPSCKRYMQHLA
ncbi:hypothetical protein GW17_00022163 [Ensete ventricosum]|nr:hypothetical protein GW17_00022163 [Ensete ventricosum]